MNLGCVILAVLFLVVAFKHSGALLVLYVAIAATFLAMSKAVPWFTLKYKK